MKQFHWHIIANPNAGGGKMQRAWPNIKKVLDDFDIQYEISFTKHIGHAISLTQELIQSGARNILAIGGDGTCHEVVNGIQQQKTIAANEILFSMIPFGTGNDWVRNYKISKNYKKAVVQLIEGKIFHQDLGLVSFFKNKIPGERHFVNIAGAAFDAFVVKNMGAKRNRFLGPFFYSYQTLKYLFKYKVQEIFLQYNEVEEKVKLYTINAGIGKYAGGGLKICPNAIQDNGFLSLTVAHEMPKWRVILNFPRFLLGNLGSHSKVDLSETQRIQMKSVQEEPLWIEADGEFLGHGPIEIRIKAKALKLLIP